MNDHELDAQGPSWVEPPALCRSLPISRSTLGRWRRQKLLRHGHHWVKKNPAAPRSDLLVPAALYRFAGEHPRPLRRRGGVFPRSRQ